MSTFREIVSFQNQCSLYRLSDFFDRGQILNNGQFISTQLVDTRIPKSITFCRSARFCDIINKNKNIRCVITGADVVKLLDPELGLVVSENPDREFYRLHNQIAKRMANENLLQETGIQKTARIHTTALIESGCYIGEGVQVEPGAIILRNSYVGNNSIIGPNVVIGSDGLEFKRYDDDWLLKVVHSGGVFIGDDVEIMANSVVGKDVFMGFTVIGNGTKIGPLSNIGHRASIGEKCCFGGNSSVSGSVRVGDSVWIGPSSTIGNGISIGSGAYITMGSVVVKHVKPGGKVSGFFAVEHKKALKNHFVVKSL